MLKLLTIFKMCRLINISVCYLLVMSCTLAQDPVANLPQGRIVGIKVYTEGSITPIEIYYGIPYAIPPVGRYRFSAPERHTGWRRTFYAHRMPPHCPDDGDSDKDHSSEDCLFLNIWTPRPADGITLPVAVILYSESWTRSGTALPCQELAADGVVVVTVAYRLHLLAFFTLKSMSARGNLALLDQYLAILWVRDNIAAFGGDPTAVTLIGHSAGADSVLHHLTSPRSSGLFQRAIIMSPRDIWQAVDDQNHVEANDTEVVSREIARILGCNSNFDQEILQCMRSRMLSDIVSLYTNSNWSKVLQPVPDNFLPASEQYLPTTLLMAFSTTKRPLTQIDLLFGTTDLEMFNYNDGLYEDLMNKGSKYVSEYTDNIAIPTLLRMFSLHTTEMFPMLVKAVRWEFWKEKTKNDSNLLAAIENLARIETSAKWSAAGALLAARLARRVSRLYVYRYSQPGGVDLHGGQFNFSGAVHGSDLVSLLGDALMLQVSRRPSNVNEKRISSLFRQHIINFITRGSPGDGSKWKRYKAGDAYVHEIRNEVSATSTIYETSKEITFWLQYLPQLAGFLTNSGRTEQFTSDLGENRLRGGVFAMCGVSIVLLLLLCVCAILLRRQRSRRYSVSNDTH